MIRNLFFGSVFIFSAFVASAQMLDVNHPFFKEENFFNSEFIKRNKIKSMFGELATKKSMEIIKTLKLFYRYEFYPSGNLKKFSYSYIDNGKVDTNVIYFYYNQANDLLRIRKSDKFGYTTQDFEYDEKHRIIKKTLSREENKFNSKQQFELKRKYEISSETYTYHELSPLQFQKKYFNNYGKLYKIQTILFDSLGYKKEERSRYIIGGQKEILTFEYDSIGRLKTRTKEIIFQNKNTESYYYKYDELGNVMQVKYFKNEKLEYQQELVYYLTSGLLKALIEKDAGTEMLKIIKYQYTFFDE